MRTAMAATLLGMVALCASSQTLNIRSGSVTYQINATAETGIDFIGSDLSVMNRTLSLSTIDELFIDNSTVVNNLVTVNYANDNAYVVIPGNLMQYVSASVQGGHVSIAQSEEVGEDTCGEITYELSGTTTNGSFSLEGNYKSTVTLNGLTLTNPTGAAIEIANGKRINIRLAEGTNNTLTDGANGDHKGALTAKGHFEFKGYGSLTVAGNTAHAIHCGDQMEIKNCSLTVTKAVKDGINVNRYFLMESGSINISGIGDEGIQVSYDSETDRSTEDTGSFSMSGGSITVNSTASSSKGIKSEGDMTISGGNLYVKATGSQCEGIESKSVMTLSGGSIFVSATDDAINSGSHLYLSGADVTAMSTGNDGLDSNGNTYMSDGIVKAFGSREPESGIDANEEEGYSVIFTGGILMAGGGKNSVPTTSESTQPYLSPSLTLTAGETVVILNSDDTELAQISVPEEYTATSTGSNGGHPGGGWRPGGGGGMGGSNGSTVMLSCPGLVSGSTYTVRCGSTSATATAALQGSSSNRPW